MKSESHFEINKKGEIVICNKPSNCRLRGKIQKNKKKDNIDLTMMNVGYYLITPLLIGVFLGLLADSRLESKPVCTVIGISLGSIGSFYNLSKFIQTNAQDQH